MADQTGNSIYTFDKASLRNSKVESAAHFPIDARQLGLSAEATQAVERSINFLLGNGAFVEKGGA